MNPLLSSSELESLREVAISGMQTTVSLFRLTTTENAVGETQSWPPNGTVQGWLYSNPIHTTSIVSGVQEVIPMYRLFVPVGTDVRNGDRVAIDGKTYTVFDTDAESTWLAMLTVTLRKGE